MNPAEVLRVVDAIHRDKKIEKEIVFQAIEAALISAARKHYGEEAEIHFEIHREGGIIQGVCDGEVLDHEEVIGRIGAQTAKQVIIQKIREAERDALYDEYTSLQGQMVSGVIQRNEGGAATVALSNVEAILPRSEQIPGESHHANERVRATVFDVRKQGSRVKVLLSRIRPQLVQSLFEQEIPEVSEAVIAVEAIAREAGYRSKVAVSSTDARVDCVGACVGVRGNRIKNIVDELSGERIDIVRYSEDRQELIPNALQPAEVEEVILCKMMGRAIVLVREDQLSLAIGRRGQNVRLASKLCGWDIEIMTREELEEQIERAVLGYGSLEGVSDELAEALVGEGFLSYDDLSVIEPEDLMQMGELTAEQVDLIVEQAEARAEEAERAAAEERRRQREQERLDQAAAAKQSSEEAVVEQSSGEAVAEQSSEEAVAEQSSEEAVAEQSSEEAAAEQSSEEATEQSSEEAAAEQSSEEAAAEQSSEEA
ncbi:MAG: transcription termination factor NusA, partial [Planctomycetaceae bacterium]|nr:transcription termination factor NusA [Planctomycetaceae bacterium]